MHELGWRLSAVAHRQRAFGEQIGCILAALDQFVRLELPQSITRFLPAAHITLYNSSAGLPHLGNRFTCSKMYDLVDFQRFVRLTPANDWYVEHGGSLSSTGDSFRRKAAKEK